MTLYTLLPKLFRKGFIFPQILPPHSKLPPFLPTQLIANLPRLITTIRLIRKLTKRLRNPYIMAMLLMLGGVLGLILGIDDGVPLVLCPALMTSRVLVEKKALVREVGVPVSLGALFDFAHAFRVVVSAGVAFVEEGEGDEFAFA